MTSYYLHLSKIFDKLSIMLTEKQFLILKEEHQNYERANTKALECEQIIKNRISTAESVKSTYLLRGMSHEIMKYVSNYLIDRTNSNTFSFPFLNAQFLREPYLIKFKTVRLKYKYAFLFRERRFVELSSFYMHRNFLERAASAIITKVLANRYVSKYGFRTKLIDKKHLHADRFLILSGCLHDLAEFLRLDESSRNIFVTNFINYVKAMQVWDTQPINQYFYSGSLMAPASAYRASLYRELDFGVVAKDHGDATAFFRDEPFVRLTETLLPTNYGVYGDLQAVKDILREDQSSFVNIPKIFSLEPRAERRRQKKVGVHLNRRKMGVLLYCPTGLSGNERYSPFHSISDESYIIWQRYLIESLINRGYEVIYKKHPKNKTDKSLNIDGLTVVETNLFELDMTCYEAIVFDYVSTGYHLALAQGLHIWYFDIGLRKMKKGFYTPFNQLGIKPISFAGDLNSQVNTVISVYKHLKEPLSQKFYLKGVKH